MTERVSSCWYLAPEQILTPRDYGAAVDVWSAGCIFAEMLLGRAAFPGANELNQVSTASTRVHITLPDFMCDVDVCKLSVTYDSNSDSVSSDVGNFGRHSSGGKRLGPRASRYAQQASQESSLPSALTARRETVAPSTARYVDTVCVHAHCM